ncbi:hypothetical protein DFH11DRAFT_722659 [Phellopilus nigrolimitatus]|nr:hypothetical protein DFH11DRAFT_722659 [Phellopilus nigrolimitatus]
MELAGGQKPHALYTANLYTANVLMAPPDPRELYAPPPEMCLLSNACISPSPHVNVDPSYQRCTINAVPTTSALLNLGLSSCRTARSRRVILRSHSSPTLSLRAAAATRRTSTPSYS